MECLSFWKGRRVFLTGHTGFKGSWLSYLLIDLGAELTGYSLAPPSSPNLFEICNIKNKMVSFIGDIRDRQSLLKAFSQVRPEIVIHMAAQPLVQESYQDPIFTYETNVMGTANLLECVRLCGSVQSVLNITTDKVYLNREWHRGYREEDYLDGYDPYSNSKSCSELVTHCYQRSFLNASGVAVSTARSGNVIGGGDYSKNRIIPDCIRAVQKGIPIGVRNPFSIRPYQHVLESIVAYLMIAKGQYCRPELAGAYNVGPDDQDCITTGKLVDLFCKSWGKGATWENLYNQRPYHEANILKLDCSKIRDILLWQPRWSVSQAIDKTVEWAKSFEKGDHILSIMDQQVQQYFTECSKQQENTHTL